MDDHWELLGLAPTLDERAVKRAYAALVKKHKPEADPEDYTRVRAAFDAALAEIRWRANDEANSVTAAEGKSETADGELPPVATLSVVATDTSDNSWNPRAVEQVAPLFEQLLMRLDGLDDQTAADVLNEFVAECWDQPVDARRVLEADLLGWLCEYNEQHIPVQLAEAASELFGWYEVSSRSSGNGNAAEVLDYRLRGALIVRNFEHNRKEYVRSSGTRDTSKAAGILSAPFDLRRNRRLRRKGSVAKAVRAQIDELENYAPNYLRNEFSEETIEFWQAEPEYRAFTAREHGTTTFAYAIAAFSFLWYYPEYWQWAKESIVLGSLALAAGWAVFHPAVFWLLRLTEERIPVAWVESISQFRARSQIFRSDLRVRTGSSLLLLVIFWVPAGEQLGPLNISLSLLAIAVFYCTHPAMGFAAAGAVYLGALLFSVAAILSVGAGALPAAVVGSVALSCSFLVHLGLRRYMDRRGLWFFHETESAVARNCFRYLGVYLLAAAILAAGLKYSAPYFPASSEQSNDNSALRMPAQ